MTAVCNYVIKWQMSTSQWLNGYGLSYVC